LGELVFFYGTLMDDDVRRAVLGATAPASAEPAVLGGWRRVSAVGTPYPTVVRDSGRQVEGVLVRGLDYVACRQLTAYEGRDYGLVDVEVTVGDRSVAAMMFAAPNPTVRSHAGGWSFATWTRRHKRATLAAISRRRPSTGRG